DHVDGIDPEIPRPDGDVAHPHGRVRHGAMQEHECGRVRRTTGHDEGLPLTGLDAQPLVRNRPGVQEFAVTPLEESLSLRGGIDAAVHRLSSNMVTIRSNSALLSGPPTMTIF